MKTILQITLIVLSVLLVLAIIGLAVAGITAIQTHRTNHDPWTGPSEGLWYCDELRLQINFTYSNQDIEYNDILSYVYEDGRYIMCHPRGKGRQEANTLRVINQDLSTNDPEKTTEPIFVAENVSVNENEYVVRDQNGVEYTFYRLGEFDLEEYRASAKEKFVEIIPQETPERVDHVEVVAKIASDLWKQTFAEKDFSEEDIQILYDYEARCWLATVSSASDDLSFNALIEKDGDVLGVWEQEGSSASSD